VEGVGVRYAGAAATACAAALTLKTNFAASAWQIALSMRDAKIAASRGPGRDLNMGMRLMCVQAVAGALNDGKITSFSAANLVC
jgi:class 3 adenylate cyclase